MAENYNPYTDGMVFKPAPDITAWELARTIQRVFNVGVIMHPDEIAKWPREMQRHWRPVQRPEGG